METAQKPTSPPNMMLSLLKGHFEPQNTAAVPKLKPIDDGMNSNNSNHMCI